MSPERERYVVTRQIHAVDIQEREDFDDLLRLLRQHRGSTLTIDVATGVDSLSVPDEFEELAVAARYHDVELEIVTDDPVRQEFARIYGMLVLPGADCDTIELIDARLDVTEQFSLPDEEPGLVRQQVEKLSEIAEFGLSDGGRETSPAWSPFETGASYSFVTAGSQPAFDERKAARARQRRNGRRGRTTVSRSLSPSAVVVSAMVVAVAVAVLLIGLLAPSARIQIVPETQALTAEVRYGLAGSGAGLDVVVEPVPMIETLTFETTVPASGERLVPDDAARGMIFLTNPHTEPFELSAGSVFATEGGQAFLSLESITIPAADPFVSAQFGTAAVGIEAVDPGPAGNLDAGDLTGTLDSGIIYQNRFPFEGGSLRSVAIVTQADLDGLRDLATQEFASRTGNALDGQVPDGWILVNGAEQAGEITLTYTAEVGAAVEEVAVIATIDVAGEIYNPGDLEQAAREHLLTAMSGSVPGGFGLDVETLRFSTPQPVDNANTPALRMSAEGTATAQIGPEAEAQLRSDLVGKGQDRAALVLAQMPGVESYSMEYGPSWLPWRPVPRLGERISINVSGS